MSPYARWAIIKIIILQENKIYSKHTFFKYLFLMIKMVDIILFEGLKEALERGDSLQRAMMSFYNAGYSREAIEEAARELQIQQQRQQIIQQVPYSPQPVKKEIDAIKAPREGARVYVKEDILPTEQLGCFYTAGNCFVLPTPFFRICSGI